MNDVILVLDCDGRCLTIEKTGAPQGFRLPAELIGKLDHVFATEAADRIVEKFGNRSTRVGR